MHAANRTCFFQVGKTDSNTTGSSTRTSPSPKAQKGRVRTSADVEKTAVDGGSVGSPAVVVAAGRMPEHRPDSALQREEQQEVDAGFPLTPLATPTSQRKKLGGEGGGGGEYLWEESFNRWVVLEVETLNEARKTDQLAFLELEAIKVGMSQTGRVVAPRGFSLWRGGGEYSWCCTAILLRRGTLGFCCGWDDVHRRLTGLATFIWHAVRHGHLACVLTSRCSSRHEPHADPPPFSRQRTS